ncbi:MAG: AMP-dependent synthetase [Deltaproteobacteria bacterium]|nr:AMP-dependent synthetase [Deltaproteobacteria bacterium]
MDLADRIHAVLALDPDAPGVEFEDHWYSWGELAALMRDIDAALSEAGIGDDAAIAVMLRNRPSLLGAMMSVITSRRCVLTVNAIQGASKLVEEIGSLRAPALIGHADDWTGVGLPEAAQRVGCLGIEVYEAPKLGMRLRPGLETLDPGPHHEPLPGVAVQMLTSGTTGPPKRVPLRLAALTESLASAAGYESKGGSDEPRLRSGVVLMPNPLVHVGGIFRAGGALFSGRRISMMERFDLEPWHELVQRHRPKAVSLVPAAVKMVLDAEFPPEDLASLRIVSTGTAPLDPATAEAFEARYGVPVLTTYGATEFAGGVAGWTLRDYKAYSKAKRGSVGRANAGVALQIVDQESGAVLAPGEIGLLEVKTRQHSEELGWVRTTDLARLDADGFLWVIGRADGAINRGGFKLLPHQIEKVLEQHSSVAEASVVGIEDPRLGEVPVAAVLLREGAPTIDESELERFAAEHLTGYQRPTRYRIVAALPRTPSMKVSQPEVRHLFEQPGKPS